MSFETLLSEFVVVLCNTRSMLVKARWASPIHYFCCCVGRVDRYWLVRACEKLCDVARLAERLRPLRTPGFRLRAKVGTREGLNTAPRAQCVPCSRYQPDFRPWETRFMNFSAEFKNERSRELFRDASRAVWTF